ncbi:unnamed protein product [Cylicocyclus nassatus]|uniref:Aminopeptidase n=1 Tax=Cylicocyclus nassatus TaxID=53992 RepID=A0AA36H539_CYLNA|nr:unnamed protein product [Cylicocyclus nassatus]
MDSGGDQVSQSSSKTSTEQTARSSKKWLYVSACITIGILVIVSIIVIFLLRSPKDEGTEVKGKTNIYVLPQEYRLPGTLVPSSYELVLQTYLPFYVDIPKEKNLTIDAEVTIKMLVHKPTNVIVLNQAGISVIKEKCRATSNGKAVDIQEVDFDHTHEKVSFYLRDSLPVGQEVMLKVPYSAPINNGSNGLYQNLYRDSNNKTKIAAVTHVEPTSARKMVPCFDEPEYKAFWKVKIIHPKGTIAISNAKESDVITQQGGKWTTSTFEPTPIMSSYLLALLVSEFTYNQMQTNRGVRFRLWSAPATKSQREYGLKVATTVMESFEKYFGVNDVMSKQDLVALENFEAGAMENWGMITFRKAYLLDLSQKSHKDPLEFKREQHERRRQVETTVAHELTHQWFGNLVTLSWWEELWLNEGFAAYFEDVRLLGPADEGMEISKDEFVEETEDALVEDARVSGRPMSSIIHEFREIGSSFDTISYNRGAAIIAMLRAVIGNKNFQKGLTHYLKKFSFKCTKSEDLWQALSDVCEGVKGPSGSSLDLKNFGTQWTKMMGYPLVTARFSSDTLEITQQRYTLNTSIQEHEKYRSPRQSYKWDVPIWLKTKKGDTILEWLKANEPLHINLGSLQMPVVINAHRNGYYRQNYDRTGWELIAAQFTRNSVFDQYTRYVLLSDAFSAAAIGQLEYELVFKLIRYAYTSRNGEKQWLPWKAIVVEMMKIYRMYPGTSENAFYVRLYIEKVLRPILIEIGKKFFAEETEFAEHIRKQNESLKERITGRLGWESMRWESNSALNLAVSVLDLYCRLGSGCSSLSRSLFEREVLRRCDTTAKASECVGIHSSFRGFAYCQGIKELGLVAFQKVSNFLMIEDDADERKRLHTGLGCIQNVDVLERRLLEMLDKKTTYNDREIADVFHSAANNPPPPSNDSLLRLCISKWKAFHEKFAKNHEVLSDFIKDCISKVHSREEMLMIESAHKSCCIGKSDDVVQAGLELAEFRIKWIEKYSKIVSDLTRAELERLKKKDNVIKHDYVEVETEYEELTLY